jgi:hypothetical protein
LIPQKRAVEVEAAAVSAQVEGVHGSAILEAVVA